MSEFSIIINITSSDFKEIVIEPWGDRYQSEPDTQFLLTTNRDIESKPHDFSISLGGDSLIVYIESSSNYSLSEIEN